MRRPVRRVGAVGAISGVRREDCSGRPTPNPPRQDRRAQAAPPTQAPSPSPRTSSTSTWLPGSRHLHGRGGRAASGRLARPSLFAQLLVHRGCAACTARTPGPGRPDRCVPAQPACTPRCAPAPVASPRRHQNQEGGAWRDLGPLPAGNSFPRFGTWRRPAPHLDVLASTSPRLRLNITSVPLNITPASTQHHQASTQTTSPQNHKASPRSPGFASASPHSPGFASASRSVFGPVFGA